MIGGGAGGLVILVLTLLLGGNLGSVGDGSAGGGLNPGVDTQLIPGQVQSGGAQSGDFSRCRTGADANRDVQCRVIGTVNSVQDYWADELPRLGTAYRKVNTVLYSGVTRSACGTASNQVGLLDRAQKNLKGQNSGAVRTELMADCFAGVWANHASSTQAANGEAFLKPLTPADISSALSAASAVGDDRIQQKTQGRVTPESWTHGSSAARQKWFLTGYQSGSAQRCDTFKSASVG